MFETAEVGHEVSKADFEKVQHKLHADLLAVQRRLREAKFQVIVIVSGVETAGKSQVVNRLNEWLDVRSVQTTAFWDESDEERDRPRYWRFWRSLPADGTIGILFGSWYTQPIVQRAYRKIGNRGYRAELDRIVELERMLTDDGTVLVKLWFHLSEKEQKKRLRTIVKQQKRQLTPYEQAYSKMYDRFLKVSETAVRVTDTKNAPWQIVDAADPRYRDLMAGRILLSALEQALKRPAAERRGVRKPVPRAGKKLTVLNKVDLTATLTPEKYERKLEKLQSRLNKLAWQARGKGVSTVAMFEGWDAAGKGGAIRRVIAALDARLFRIIPIAAPTDEERAHHYLWRFWRHIPRAGYFTIYDRSWYGRVLVERVEKFATPHEWGRAFAEINSFEQQLADHGICVCKFWLHISPQEQLRRFKERQQIAYKKHKITAEDWRNREKWDVYEAAVDEMVSRTSTEDAPWTLVPANDKRVARLTVLRTLCDRLEDALNRR